MPNDHQPNDAFRLFADAVTDYAIFTLDPDGNVTTWNDDARRINGYLTDEILGQHFSRFYSPDDQAAGRPKHALAAATQHGGFVDGGWRVRKDGSRFFADVVITTLRDPASGALLGFSTITRDVTGRRRHEQELHDNETRLRNIVNEAVDGIITIDPRGTIESVNPAVERIFGYRADELVGQNVKLLMPNPYHDEHDQYLANYMRTGERKIIGIGREVLGRRRDGSIFPVDLAVSEVQLRDRRLFTGIIRDITQRKHDEQALRDSEARNRAILEAAVSGIITIDQRGTIESLNPAAERIFGYRAGELIGTNVNLLMPNPYHDEHDQYLANYVRTGERKIIGIGREVVGRRRDGSTFPMDLAVSELMVGQKRMFTGIVHDITDRKRAEQERDRLLESERAARADAERASAAKDEFIAVLSHELRTPLTPVLLTLSMLQLDPDLAPRVRADLQAMHRNVKLEAKLIDDLLDLARVASGKLLLAREPCDVHALIRSAAEMSGQPTGVRTELQLRAGEHHADADPARVQQVFWNLLSNAHKFTPLEGTITVRTSNPSPGRLRAEVIDTGQGIAPELLPKVFNAFEQGNPVTARSFGGLGLGLAIARAIVQAHGGTIGAHSEGRGRGSTFVIELPTAVMPPAVPAAPATDAPNNSAASTHVPPLRVLLVEDHQPTLHVLTRLLEQMGHHVTPAGSARAALLAAEHAATPFDVLVSDIGLPDGTGYDVIRELRARHGLRGVAVSGFGMADDIRRSMEAGFEEHLIKPVEIARLSAALAQLQTPPPPTHSPAPAPASKTSA